jgi:hypothetical protein
MTCHCQNIFVGSKTNSAPHTATHQHKSKGKGKIVPVIFLTEHHAMKAYWSGGIAPHMYHFYGSKADES